MKKYLLACTACLALLTTSCGISREATNNRNVTQSEVVLSQRNYKVVGMVSGESSQNYWFGIGGLSRKSLGESAMSEMYKNANLMGSQAIINVNVAYKNKFILIYSGAKAIATGTVIQFVDNMDESVSINEVKAEENGQNEIKDADNGQKKLFSLTFWRKKVENKKWILIKEKHYKVTLQKATEIANDWNNKSDSKIDFKCTIKPIK